MKNSFERSTFCSFEKSLHFIPSYLGIKNVSLLIIIMDLFVHRKVFETISEPFWRCVEMTNDLYRYSLLEYMDCAILNYFGIFMHKGRESLTSNIIFVIMHLWSIWYNISLSVHLQSFKIKISLNWDSIWKYIISVESVKDFQGDLIQNQLRKSLKCHQTRKYFCNKGLTG